MAADIDGIVRHFEHLLRQDLTHLEDLIHRVERARGDPQAAGRMKAALDAAQTKLGARADRWLLTPCQKLDNRIPVEAALDGDGELVIAALG
jgi:hypothetical protein